MNSNVITFAANVDNLLALKFASGREVSNGRIMFSTPEDERFFLDPDDAAKLEALGLKPSEAFYLRMAVTGNGKARKKVFHFRRAEETPVAPTQREPERPIPAPTTTARAVQPAPVAISRPDSQAAPSASNSQSFSNVLASSYIAAIDGILRAKEYAESKGVSFTVEPIRITAEDLRSSASCIFIQYFKAQEQKQRRGAA